MKTFRLGHVLSITHGTLLCEGEKYPIDGVYKILNFLAGDEIFTHQIPSAMRQCRPHVLAQHPQFKDLVLPEGNRDNWGSVLSELKRKYGDEFAITPLPSAQRRHRHPLDDLPSGATVVVVDP